MRKMMIVLTAMSLLGTLVGVIPGDAQTKKSATKKTAHMMYECKMCHTQSAKAGNCSKCGMKMTKMARMDHSKMGKMEHAKRDHSKMDHAHMMYECKMCHTQSAKAGNCSKCGMKMTKMASMGKKK
jgi:uncharacterized protein involved in copper resistance